MPTRARVSTLFSMSCLDTESWFIFFRDAPFDVSGWKGTHVDGSLYAHEIGLWRGVDFPTPMKEQYVYAYTVEGTPPRIILLSGPEYFLDAVTEVDTKTAVTTFLRLDADSNARLVITKNRDMETLSVLFHPDLANVALLYRLALPAYEEISPPAEIKLAREEKANAGPALVKAEAEEPLRRATAPPAEGQGDWGPVPVIDAFEPQPAIALSGLIRYAIYPSVRVGKVSKDGQTRGVTTFTAPWILAPDSPVENITVFNNGEHVYEIWPNVRSHPLPLPITYGHVPATKGHLCIPVPSEGDAYLFAAQTLKRSGHEDVFTREFAIESDTLSDARVVCAEDKNGHRLFMWITGKNKAGHLADVGNIMFAANKQFNADLNTRV